MHVRHKQFDKNHISIVFITQMGYVICILVKISSPAKLAECFQIIMTIDKSTG